MVVLPTLAPHSALVLGLGTPLGGLGLTASAVPEGRCLTASVAPPVVGLPSASYELRHYQPRSDTFRTATVTEVTPS